MQKDFESYLMDKFADSIRCTEDDVLDDDFPDAFDNWLCELDVDQLIIYANIYATERCIEELKKVKEVLK